MSRNRFAYISTLLSVVFLSAASQASPPEDLGFTSPLVSQDCYVKVGEASCFDKHGVHKANLQTCNDSEEPCDEALECKETFSNTYISEDGWSVKHTQVDPVAAPNGKAGSNTEIHCVTYHDCNACELFEYLNQYRCLNGVWIGSDVVDDWTLTWDCFQSGGGIEDVE